MYLYTEKQVPYPLGNYQVLKVLSLTHMAGLQRIKTDASNSSVLEAILQYQPKAYVILLNFHQRLLFLQSHSTDQPALLKSIFPLNNQNVI